MQQLKLLEPERMLVAQECVVVGTDVQRQLDSALQSDREWRVRRRAELERTLRRFPWCYIPCAAFLGAMSAWLISYLVCRVCFNGYGWPGVPQGMPRTFSDFAWLVVFTVTFIGQSLTANAATGAVRRRQAALERELAEYSVGGESSGSETELSAPGPLTELVEP